MSDLPLLIHSANQKANPESNHPSCLIWADDIILLSESDKGLEYMLKAMEGYCKGNELLLNTDKTKVMIFNKTGRLIRKNFIFNNIQLETVRSYKYLGFLITPSGEINSGLNDLRDRAMKAFFKLKTTVGTQFNRNIQTMVNLFDSLIKPILLYCSDFWGCLKLPKNNPIENFHHMACKHILGVQKQTTNIGVLLELGRIPLQIFARKASIKNWERIKSGRVNPLLKTCYENAVGDELPWINGIRQCLEMNGMLWSYINSYENKPAFIHKKLFQRLSDSFHQDAFSTISNPQSKLRTYALLKREIGFENYLNEISNPDIRHTVTKFRLSNHKLNIEVGRHKNIPEKLRFCPFCINTVETEIHFLLKCPIYNIPRGELVDKITSMKPNFIFYSETEKLQYLLSDTNIKISSKYLKKIMDIREFLINHPKMYC